MKGVARSYVAVWQAAVIIAAVVAVVGLLALLGWICQEWATLTERETGTASLRNVALVIGGPVAVGLAVWRSITAQRQIEAAQRQTQIAQFQQGAELLGHGQLSVRASGARSLYDLASRDLDRYGDLTNKVLNDFSVVRQDPKKAEASVGSHESIDGAVYVGPVDGAMARDFSKRLVAEMQKRDPSYRGSPLRDDDASEA